MVISKDTKDKIIEDIISKASNNNDHQIFIRPSGYGFGRMSDDTKEFQKFLLDLSIVKDAKIMGKDLIYCTVKIQNNPA